MANDAYYVMYAYAKDMVDLGRLLCIMNYEDPDWYLYRVFEVGGDDDITEVKDRNGQTWWRMGISGCVAWDCTPWFDDDED